jgi:hypothetical protein
VEENGVLGKLHNLIKYIRLTLQRRQEFKRCAIDNPKWVEFNKLEVSISYHISCALLVMNICCRPVGSPPRIMLLPTWAASSISTQSSELRNIWRFKLTIFQSLTVLVERLHCISLLWHLTWQADFWCVAKPRFVKFVSDSTVSRK